jgi:predicted Zn-dependent protease
VKLADRMLTRVLPIGEVDERRLGDAYRRIYDSRVASSDHDQRDVDALMAELVPFTGKDFPYRAYVIDYGAPNAMALPGGVVLVTRELLSTVDSESELVSILAHELGHIERGHCFDAVRFELLARKVGADTLGALADFAAQVLLRHSYSKTVEHEADEYSFQLVANSRYDPRGVSGAFRSLEAYVSGAGISTPQHGDPIRDYFTSHPPLEIRAEEFGQRAEAWWRRHSGEHRYVGVRNLDARLAMPVRDFPEEWTTP